MEFKLGKQYIGDHPQISINRKDCIVEITNYSKHYYYYNIIHETEESLKSPHPLSGKFGESSRFADWLVPYEEEKIEEVEVKTATFEDLIGG